MKAVSKNTLSKESIDQMGARVVQTTEAEQIGSMEMGEIMSLSDSKSAGKGAEDNFAAGFNALKETPAMKAMAKKDRAIYDKAVRKLDNAKHCAFCLDELVGKGSLTRDQYYSKLSVAKCVAIRKAMGGSGAKPRIILDADTVIEIVKSAKSGALIPEIECQSNDGMSLKEKAAQSKAASSGSSGGPVVINHDSGSTSSTGNTGSTGSTSTTPDKSKSKSDPTALYVATVKDLQASVEALPPANVDALADAVQELLEVLRPSNITPIKAAKPKTTPATRKRPAKKQVAAKKQKRSATAKVVTA